MSKLRSRNINLLENYNRSKKNSTKKAGSGKFKYFVPFIIIVLIGGAVFAVNTLDVIKKNAQLATVQSYISANSAEYEDAQSVSEQLTQATDQKDDLTEEENYEKSMPTIDAALFDKIEACMGTGYAISVYQYDEKSGLLTMNVTTPSVNDMPQFIERLRATGLFLHIEYTGYASDSNGTYNSTVGCVLTSSATTPSDATTAGEAQ